MGNKDRYEKIAESYAVDRTAAIVTSQAGCDDNIFNRTDEEMLIALKAQKRKYADDVCALKEEMGIKPNWGGSGKNKLPRHILNHPKYHNFTHLRVKLKELDIGINALNKKLKTNKPRFADAFVTITRERHPDIFEEIKGVINKQQEK